MGSVLLIAGSYAIVGFCWELVTKWMFQQSRIKPLRGLTPPERDLLRSYLEGETKTMSFDDLNPAVISLVHEKVLSKPVNIVGAFSGKSPGTPVVIESWAYEHLKKNPKLVGR